MRHLIIALAICALAAATATGAQASARLIYKVDKVTAAVDHGRLIVTANGAVRSGGWTLPRLRMQANHVAESDTEVYEFVASPPLATAIVIQALLPVSATATFPLPRYGTTQIKVLSETNAVTAPYQTTPAAASPARSAKPYR